MRLGITTVGALLEDDSNYDLTAPSWKAIYKDTIQKLTLSTPTNSTDCPPLNLWYQCNSVKLVNYLNLAGAEPPRQSGEVWKAFFNSELPSPRCDEVYQALWNKLPVGERLRCWWPGDIACPLDGASESILHATTACKFLPAACFLLTIDKCFPADECRMSASAQ